MNPKTDSAPGSRDPFLHSKLMPPRLHADAIRREALLRRLDEGLQRKLILLSAPTGFGKSTLVSSWLAARSFRSAWVTLDGGDSDPARFWTYVISALRTLDDSLGKASLSMLMSPQRTGLQTLLSPLINELASLQESCLLVLEDFQSITSPEIDESLGFFLQHLPPSLHLVLISRSDPDLPLGILRARNEMLELNAGQLRFSQAEAQQFLKTATKAEVPSAILAHILEKTEGWPAGLRLLALSLQETSRASDVEKIAGSFSGSSRHVADYLIQEVFEKQPHETRSFLMRTCFLNRLTGALCDAVIRQASQDPPAMAIPCSQTLERLEREGLFLEQLEQSGGKIWYRYNPLFAESLQQLARQRLEQGEIDALFERASAWYEVQGMLVEAIELLLAANRFEHALELIERYIDIHELSEMQTLGRWLESIPPQDVLPHPLICFTYAQVLLYTGDRYSPATARRIEPLLAAAETAWQAGEDRPKLGQVLSFRGIVAWWQGNLARAFEYAHHALDELPEQDVFWRGNSLLIVVREALDSGQVTAAQDLALEARALLGAAQNIFGQLAATHMLGEVFYWQGELEQAEQLNRQVLVEAVGDESMLDDQGFASLSLAHIAYERNDLEAAWQLTSRAAELARQRLNDHLQVQAGIQLALIHAARGQQAQGRDLLKSLEAVIQNRSLLRDLQDAQALLTIRANEPGALDWWLDVLLQDERHGMPVRQEREDFIRARLRLAQGKPLEALEALQDWKSHAAGHGRVRRQAEALCLEALAKHAARDAPGAAEALREALQIGQASGFRRTFLDEGAQMGALLKDLQPSLTNRALSLYAAGLLQSLTDRPTGDAPLVEALSAQETRVLRLLAAGLSNAEIAEQLVVSTNTIKTQVKSIYRKLNAKSRHEASQLARELKLL